MMRATAHLLDRIAARQLADSLVRRAARWLLLLASLYALLLLVSRMTALIPPLFPAPSLLAPPLLALLLALLLRRRSDARRQAARAADACSGSDDLFLTASLLEGAPGEYQPLVLARAEQHAERIAPRQVVPFRWSRPAGSATVAMLMLAAGVLFLPQLDPLGRQQDRRRHAERSKLLAAQHKATRARLAELKKQDVEAPRTREVELALDQLQRALRAMQAKQPKANLQRLARQQATLGKLWRARQAAALARALQRTPADQRLGQAAPKGLQAGVDALKEGSAEKLRKRLKKLEHQLKRLKKLDPQARQQAKKQLRKELRAMKEALSQVQSKALHRALKNALDTLRNNQQDLSPEERQALKDSLYQAQLELEKLAQNARDLKQLEQALRTLQLARNLNGQGLDGSLVEGLKALREYRDLYERLLREREGKQGKGTGKPGGGGGKVEEKPDAKTDFVTERSRSTLTAGKMLMRIKGDQRSLKAGKAKENYQHSLQQVKQGVGEAILQEQVPPGYHETIRKYFDTLGGSKTPRDKK